jgi:hypothetical protein
MAYNDVMEVCDVDTVRKQTYITPEQDRRLKEMAAANRTTEADILRRALQQWLDSHAVRSDDDPFGRLIGVVSGPRDVDHDDIYE